MGTYYTGYDGMEYYDSEMESPHEKRTRAKPRYYVIHQYLGSNSNVPGRKIWGSFPSHKDAWEWMNRASEKMGEKFRFYVCTHTELMRKFKGDGETIYQPM